jgi:flagellar hook-length control protein FliK
MPRSAFGDRFDNALGKAEARREAAQPSIAARSKHAERRHTSVPASTDSPTRSPGDKLSGPAADARQEKISTKGDSGQNQEGSDDGRDEETTKVRKKATQPDMLLPEELLAAGMATPVTMDESAAKANTSSSDGSDHPADATGGKVTPPTATSLPSTDTESGATVSRVAPVLPNQSPGQAPADATLNGEGNRSTAQAPSSEAASEAGKDHAQQVVQAENQETLAETQTSVNDTSIKEGHLEQDKSRLLSEAGIAQLNVKPLTGSNASDPADLQSPFDSVMRVNDLSSSQNAPSAGQFADNDFSSSSDARSEQSPPKSNLLPAEDGSLRPQFLDQTTGVSPSAPPSGDSRVGRSEIGQATPMHASESERISDLRGTFSSAQSVTLDLDPLDMGPLRVRVMMTDQMVHAHIRTEHGELGQGLLQQGQSLEASLRTSGLEMGMLRVTVDQQQQGRGDNAWAFQQQPGRPGTASGPPSAPGESEAVSRLEYVVHNNGRVSFFA